MERGSDDLARVFAASYGRGRILEFVDSLSGSSDIYEKWVLVVSSQFGCPVGCLMCDTKGYYMGNPTTEELMSQVDHMVKRRFPDGRIPSRKFKVQFARMGEPALNPSVLDAIVEIGRRYDAPGFMPCISTMAPSGCDPFFEDLAVLNHDVFKGRFQLQFSIHSTDPGERDRIIPREKWDLARISDYGRHFFLGGRKISLNFALGPDKDIDADVIRSIFPRDIFMLKVTPINPTGSATMNRMVREKLYESEISGLDELRSAGYDVILSVGDPRENEILSNCGQLAALWRSESTS